VRLFLTTSGNLQRKTPEAAPGNLFTSEKFAFSACCIEIDIPFHKIMQTKEHGTPGGKSHCPGRCGDNDGPEDFQNDNNVEPVFPPASDLSFFNQSPIGLPFDIGFPVVKDGMHIFFDLIFPFSL